MKFAIVVMCTLAYLAQAQFAPGGFGPGFGAVGPVGPVGAVPVPVPVPAPFFPPFPFIGPFFRPFGFGFGFGPFGFRRRFFGKRDVEETPVVETPETLNTTRTFCRYLQEKSVFSCKGVEEEFDCEVKPNLKELGSFSFRSLNLRFTPHSYTSETIETPIDIFRIVSRNSTHTVFDPVAKKEILLSVYPTETVTEPGFWFTDSKCWERFSTLVRQPTEDVRLALTLSQ